MYMNINSNATIRICSHKDHIILTLLDPRSSKLVERGIGQSLSGFNRLDVEMSGEAAILLTGMKAKSSEDGAIAMECLNKYNIWWMSKKGGIIIPINDASINVFELPAHTVIDNVVDPKIVELIENSK